MSEEKNKKEIEIKINQDFPHPTVGVLVCNDKGEVLLVKGEKFGESWVIPGGHVEMGEKCVDAAKREIKEEVNLEISDVEFLQYQDSIYPKDWKIKRHFIFMDFTAKLKSGEIKLNEELEAYGWFEPKHALKELELSKGARGIVEVFLEKNGKGKKKMFSKKCEKCDEYKQDWVRALADYKNLQKDTEKRRGEMTVFLKQQILEDFIPVYENFKKAFAMEIKDGNEGWVQGIEYIKKQFEQTLKNYGVEEIKTVGEKFDENMHEAVSEEEGEESGLVLKELSGGYKMGEKVVIPAKVVVSK